MAPKLNQFIQLAKFDTVFVPFWIVKRPAYSETGISLMNKDVQMGSVLLKMTKLYQKVVQKGHQIFSLT